MAMSAAALGLRSASRAARTRAAAGVARTFASSAPPAGNFPGGVGHSGHLSPSLRNQHDVPEVDEATTLSAKYKYLFDLNGFLIVRGVLSEEEVAAANAAIDNHLDTLHERSGKLRTSGLYGRQSDALAGDGATGRMDMGGFLGWDKPHCEPFRQVSQ